jgi:outer membrane protein assembly factor BamB
MKKTLIISVIVVSAFVSKVCAEDEWSRFRGPNGAGYSDTEIPAEWGAEQFKWTMELPAVGHGSPVVSGTRIYVLCGDEATGDRIPVCIDAKDGSVIWQQRINDAVNKHHKFNAIASTTPALDTEHAYFSWGTKENLTVAAFTLAGEPVWTEKLGPVNGGHGFGASPMVYKGLVVINKDQEETGEWIALDAETGAVRWRLPRKSQRISYSTACVYKEHLVLNNWQHGLTGVDPLTGKVIWEKSVYDTSTNERAISSPVVAGDLVLATCGFTKNPKHCVALRPGENGVVEEVWRIERTVPHIPCLLVHKDWVFLWEDNGIVSCVEHQTGKTLWKERVSGNYFGSPVCAKDKIFCIDKAGTVSVIAASDTFEMLATNELEELCRSTPAIANGEMYVRTYSRLMAIR